MLTYLAAITFAQSSLINKDHIKGYLTHEAPWADSHAAKDDYLGAGMLYYALAYMQKAKMCVCLGSGGGFVPRVMRQAQRDLALVGSRTVLVDGNMGKCGTPKWLASDSFFKREYPDVEIIIDTTHNAALANNWCIDYLHIDADHSFEGALQDFKDYLPLMAEKGIITFHDTGGTLTCAKVVSVIRNLGYDIVDFNTLGAGVAIITTQKRER